MSTKTREERINEMADQLYRLLKSNLKFQFDNCGCRHESDCSCDFCEAVKVIEWIDQKPLTL